MKLAHTIFPSVSFIKLYDLLGIVDSKIGNPLLKTIKRVDALLYKGWDNIHPLGFNKAEEDEAIFTLALTSPAVFLLFPFLHRIKDNWLLDNENKKVRQHMMSYYVNCVKRFMYAKGNHRTYLSKNVLSSGRINCLMEQFPDARVIYLARNPFESLPSFISMFAVMYHTHSPKMRNNDEAMQVWATLGIAFYKHINQARKKIPIENFKDIKYDDLVSQPSGTVQSIYGKFNWPLSNALIGKLEQEELKNRSYRSKHHYSLEQYGLSRSKIHDELKFVFDEFGFDR